MNPLKKGEELCDVCNGIGWFGHTHWKEKFKDIYGKEKTVSYKEPLHCDKCKGAGKLDWIEMVTGKQPPTVTEYLDEMTSKGLKIIKPNYGHQ